MSTHPSVIWLSQPCPWWLAAPLSFYSSPLDGVRCRPGWRCQQLTGKGGTMATTYGPWLPALTFSGEVGMWIGRKTRGRRQEDITESGHSSFRSRVVGRTGADNVTDSSRLQFRAYMRMCTHACIQLCVHACLGSHMTRRSFSSLRVAFLELLLLSTRFRSRVSHPHHCVVYSRLGDPRASKRVSCLLLEILVLQMQPVHLIL